MSLVADVFDVLLIDKETNEVVATTTLTEANIEVSVTENEVRGGKNNNLIGILHAGRDININLTDAEFRYEWLAKQLGQDIKTGAGIAYAMPKFYTVDEAGVITLEHEPIEGSVKVFDINGKEITGTVSGNTVTLTGVQPGDKVEVRTYKYQTDANTETIEINNKVFAKGVMCILETLEIDGEENPLSKIQYQFDKAVPSGNFTINTASERTAQTQQFDLRVIKPQNSDVVGRVLRIPVDDK